MKINYPSSNLKIFSLDELYTSIVINLKIDNFGTVDNKNILRVVEYINNKLQAKYYELMLWLHQFVKEKTKQNADGGFPPLELEVSKVEVEVGVEQKNPEPSVSKHGQFKEITDIFALFRYNIGFIASKKDLEKRQNIEPADNVVPDVLEDPPFKLYYSVIFCIKM